jgi:hypothetical protein
LKLGDEFSCPGRVVTDSGTRVVNLSCYLAEITDYRFLDEELFDESSIVLMHR